MLSRYVRQRVASLCARLKLSLTSKISVKSLIITVTVNPHRNTIYHNAHTTKNVFVANSI